MHTRWITKILAGVTVLTVGLSSVPFQSSLAANVVSTSLISQVAKSHNVSKIELTAGKTVSLKELISFQDTTRVLNWESSNTAVVEVTQDGSITTKSEGTSIIWAISEKESFAVMINVVDNLSSFIRIGTSKDNLSENLSLVKGSSLCLNCYGLPSSTKTTEYVWTSSDLKVVTVDNTGKVTAKNQGSAEIQATIKDLATGIIYEASPITITVQSKAGIISVPTPKVTLTPKPVITTVPKLTLTPSVTKVPAVTIKPTSTPTPEPTLTSTPVPTDIPEKLEMEIDIIADDTIRLKFNQPVKFTEKDICVSDSNYSTVDDSFDIKDTIYNAESTEFDIVLEDYLANSMYYYIKIYDNDEKELFSRSILTHFYEPTEVRLTYTSLGDENKAYVSDKSIVGIDANTALGVRLFSNGIDVTNTYEYWGDIEYSLVDASSDDVEFLGTEIIFNKSGETAVVVAQYTYWGNNNQDTTIVSEPVVIESEKHAPYSITQIIDWAVIEEDSQANINWDNPERCRLIAGDDVPYRVVALIADNYGTVYATDERGVDESKGICSIDDYTKPLAASDYNIAFEGTENSTYFISEDGELDIFFKDSKAVIELQTVMYNNRRSTFGAIELKIDAPREPEKLLADTDKVIVSTDSLNGYIEDVCVRGVQLTLQDQYGNIWEGERFYSISTSNSDIKNIVDSLVSIRDNEVIFDGVAIRQHTDRSNITFTIRENISKEEVKVSLMLQDPQYDVNGDVVVSSFVLDQEQTVDIVTAKEDSRQNYRLIPINVYKASRSDVKVGVYTENIYLTDSINLSLSASSCKEGDVFVAVIGPDGKAVQNLSSEDVYGTGLRINTETGRVELILAAQTYSWDSDLYAILPTGTYTVQVIYVKSNDGNRVKTTKKTTKINVVNSASQAVFESVKSTVIDTYIDDTDDVKEVVADLFLIKINNKLWTDLDVSNIVDVEYSMYRNGITIRNVKLKVPFDIEDSDGSGYEQVIQINRAFQIDVD